MDNLVTFLALRVFNPAREKILIRRFKRTQVWSIPVIEIKPVDDDPMNHIERALNDVKVRPSFKMIAAIPIITMDEEDLIWNEGVRDYLPKIFRSVIYELQYDGFVCPGLPASLTKSYDLMRWVEPDVLKSMTKLNRPTDILSKMMEKETCLT